MADVTIDASVLSSYDDKYSPCNMVWASALIGYAFCLDSSNEPVYYKTIDGGATWSAAVNLDNSQAYRRLFVWYSDWTPGNTDGIIHVGLYDNAVQWRLWYTSIDTSDDSQSAVTSIVYIGGSMSDNRYVEEGIIVSRGGRIYAEIKGGYAAYQKAYYSDNGGASWTAYAPVSEAATTTDKWTLFPGAAGNNLFCAYYDGSADILYRKSYNAAGDSWSTTAMTSNVMLYATNWYEVPLAGALRHSDGKGICAALTERDTATADLRVFELSESAHAELTPAFENQSECVLPIVFIDNISDDIYVGYVKGGTWQSSVDVVYKVSTDGGTTWGAEQQFNATTDDIRALMHGPAGLRFQPTWFNDDLNSLVTNSDNGIAFSASTIIPLASHHYRMRRAG